VEGKNVIFLKSRFSWIESSLHCMLASWCSSCAYQAFNNWCLYRWELDTLIGNMKRTSTYCIYLNGRWGYSLGLMLKYVTS